MSHKLAKAAKEIRKTNSGDKAYHILKKAMPKGIKSTSPNVARRGSL